MDMQANITGNRFKDVLIGNLKKSARDYELGQNGKEVNLFEAIKLYKQAAEKGDVSALLDCADCFVKLSGRKNVRQFSKLNEDEQRDFEAQLNLARSYDNGFYRYYREDAYLFEALFLYKQAAEQGVERAKAYYEDLRTNLCPNRRYDSEKNEWVEVELSDTELIRRAANRWWAKEHYHNDETEEFWNILIVLDDMAIKRGDVGALLDCAESYVKLAYICEKNKESDQRIKHIAKAIELLEQAVEKGDKDVRLKAQRRLGKLSEEEFLYLRELSEEEFLCLRKLYEGEYSYSGKGLFLRKASAWRTAAAENGDWESMVWLGDYHFETRQKTRGKNQYDNQKAVEWYEKFLESKETWYNPDQPTIMVEVLLKIWGRLGYCYYYGYGVERDYYMAVKYFEETIGYMDKYYTTTKKTNDYGEIYKEEMHYPHKWHLITADYNMGVCYREGHGVKRDKEEAFNYWRQHDPKDYGSGHYEVVVLLRLTDFHNNIFKKNGESWRLDAIFRGKKQQDMIHDYGRDVHDSLSIMMAREFQTII